MIKLFGENDVYEKIETHRQFLYSKGISIENLLGIFLYGSQNYKCELENSDVDTKAIYIPNLTEAIMDKPKIKNYILPNGEHCELMDIGHIVNNLYKQNINFVEILYTNYFWLNYKYKNLWLIHFKANKEAIAHYDVPRGIASVIGQTKHTLNQNPRSGKKIGNSYRLLWFLQKYAAGAPYKEALILDEEKRNRIKELKSIEELENEDLKNILYNALEANELIYKTLPKADDEKKKAIEDELRYAITTAIMINENRFFEKQGVVKNAKESYFGR